jgi:hypothetical protein
MGRSVGRVMNEGKYTVQEEILPDGEKTGLEAERADENVEVSLDIERPFDPEKIKVVRETKTISLIVTRIDHDEIDLAPEFQRRARIWDIGRKSRLIESLLLRIPLTVFYVASDAEENWSVVDGLQRLTTIHDFIQNKFRLRGLEYLTQLVDCDFDGLPRSMQRRIEETELVINVIQPGTPEEVMFNIFNRINTGGITLNGQEIRHALNKGPARDFLRMLADSHSFKEATDNSVSDNRMAARECALRFSAFWTAPWKQYETNDLDGFLNAAMQRINQIGPEKRLHLQQSFERAMQASFAVFGRDAFRKRYDKQSARNPVSKALFEAWSVSLGLRSDSEIHELIRKSDTVREQFMNLMKADREFEVAISYSTGVPRRVHKRFQAIEQLIDQVLQVRV